MFQEIVDTWKDRIWKDDRLLDLQQIARENRWRFRPEGRFPEQPTELKKFRIFKGKKSKRIRGLITVDPASLPFQARIYDYVYYAEPRKRNTTVLEFHYPAIDLHEFWIRPKRRVKQFKEIFVRQEEEFYLKDAFFEKYELIYDRSRSIKLYLNEDILESVCTRTGLTLEGNGRYLLVYYKNETISPADLIKEYRFAMDLFMEVIEHSTLLE